MRVRVQSRVRGKHPLLKVLSSKLGADNTKEEEEEEDDDDGGAHLIYWGKSTRCNLQWGNAQTQRRRRRQRGNAEMGKRGDTLQRGNAEKKR